MESVTLTHWLHEIGFTFFSPLIRYTMEFNRSGHLNSIWMSWNRYSFGSKTSTIHVIFSKSSEIGSLICNMCVPYSIERKLPSRQRGKVFGATVLGYPRNCRMFTNRFDSKKGETWLPRIHNATFWSKGGRSPHQACSMDNNKYLLIMLQSSLPLTL